MYRIKASILDTDNRIVESQVTIQEYNVLNSFLPVVSTNQGEFETIVSNENATVLVQAFGYKDAYLKAKDINAKGTVYLTEAVTVGRNEKNTWLYLGLAAIGGLGLYFFNQKKPKTVKL